jgi:hypothetical protein
MASIVVIMGIETLRRALKGLDGHDHGFGAVPTRRVSSQHDAQTATNFRASLLDLTLLGENGGMQDE